MSEPSVRQALRDLLDVIAADDLIPESVSYMRQARAALKAKSSAGEKAAFLAGWRHGYYDHGEHDCRMLPPTAERAWEDYLREGLDKSSQTL